MTLTIRLDFYNIYLYIHIYIYIYIYIHILFILIKPSVLIVETQMHLGYYFLSFYFYS